MKVDWPWEGTPFAYAPSVDARPDGQILLDIVRLSQPGGGKQWRMKVVGEADGPVLSAMVDPRSAAAVNGTSSTFLMDPVRSLSEGQMVFFVRDGGSDGDFPEAVVGGAADELHPRVQWIWNHSGGPGLAASDEVWVSWDSVRIGIARWGEPWQVVFHGSEVGGLQQANATPFHDFVTWESGNGSYLGLMGWTPERGARPFITFPGDSSRGASALGTDGVDMVWTYSKGKGPGLEPYPEGAVMMSPFATDSASLVPRRVCSYPSPHNPPVVPWQVGCGYAAVEWDVDEVLVVRLSDGRTWRLSIPNPSDPPKDRWHFGTVYAVSCDEVFLRGGIGLAMNIARVRLDALGPGEPPN